MCFLSSLLRCLSDFSPDASILKPTVSFDATLDQVVHLFTEQLAPGLFVFDQQHLVGLVTPFDIVNLLFVWLSSGQLPEFEGQTLLSLGYVPRPIEILAESSSLRDAMIAVRKHHHSAPIVDSNGKLIANFSASDIYGIIFQEIPRFTQPALSFLHRHSSSPIQVCVPLLLLIV